MTAETDESHPDPLVSFLAFRPLSHLTPLCPLPLLLPGILISPHSHRLSSSLRTILLSVISLLNEPNTFSPANVDASVMYRKWRDSKGKDREYVEIIR